VGDRESSPVRLIVALLVAMVATEGLVFLAHVLLPPLPLVAELTIDITLHVGILFPSLYAWVLSPLLHLITERSMAEKALRESEARHRAIVEAFDGLIYTVTSDYRIGFMNDNLIRRTGYDATGDLCYRVLHGRAAVCPSCINDRVFAGERVRREFESPMDHRWYYSVDTLFPLVNDGVGKLAMILDITDRKRTEHELTEAYILLQKTIASLNEAVFIVDSGTRIIKEVNVTAEKMFGYDREELVGAHTSLLHVDGEMSRQFAAAMLKEYGEKGFFETTYRMKRKDGSVFDSEHFVTPICVEDGSYQSHVCVVRDISERTRSRERLEASLREKDALLREVHHRVKNNLQIISALLGLQAQYAADSRHVRLFADSRDRIATLALIYEVMSESVDLTRIDPDVYIRQLLIHLCASHAVDTEAVAFEVSTNGIVFDIDHAIPCALIINELVSNALCHAFPKARRGRVSIGLEEPADRRVLLRVADDGVGFSFEQEQTPASFGLRLVRILVEQLEGTMAVIHDRGTEFRIEFGVTSLQETD
jgi:PAS domain S-box-containing protein